MDGLTVLSGFGDHVDRRPEVDHVAESPDASAALYSSPGRRGGGGGRTFRLTVAA